MSERVHRRKLVRHFGEVPAFESEAQEAEFWASHGLGEPALETMAPISEDVLPAPRPRTRPISVRLDASTLQRLKSLATRRHVGYQTLLKEFITERLYEEEKREGIVG